MNKKFFTTLVMASACSVGAFAADSNMPNVGIVNFTTCVMESKLGAQEQAAFEGLKKKMTSLLEDSEKKLNELSAKFNDPDYMDGLSPEKEEELKMEYRQINEDLSRYQQQYYQVLNQANMKLVQTLTDSVAKASETVAKTKNIALILNKETSFYSSPSLEVTDSVVAEMNKTFDKENPPKKDESQEGK